MCNFYTFKFQLLTSHRFPRSLILAWKSLHSPYPHCILTSPYNFTIKMNMDKNKKTTLDIPEWFSGNHNKLLVLQNDTRNIYSLGFSTTLDNEFALKPNWTNCLRTTGDPWTNPSSHCSCLWRRTVANALSSCVLWDSRRL